jgi:hypothetical protein
VQTAAIGALSAQAPQYVTLDIARNNAVSYVDGSCHERDLVRPCQH